MPNSWGHTIYRRPAAVIDRADRFGEQCTTRSCTKLPTLQITWNYITGRGGRASTASRPVCEEHGGKFADKHGVTVNETPPPEAQRQPAVAAAVDALLDGGELLRIRVFHNRSGQWYVEHFHERDPLGTTYRQLTDVLDTATLVEAIASAEAYLADTRLVPAGEWVRGDGGDATVAVLPAQRADRWFEVSWRLRVGPDDTGMWKLTRTLDERFRPFVDALGNHHMTVDRAIRVANALLAEQGWVLFTDGDWTIFDEAGAETGAWHPDQAHPERWRS